MSQNKTFGNLRDPVYTYYCQPLKMEWNNGTTYGYDQVYANTQLDGYDAPYTVPYGEAPTRTTPAARKSLVREPVASYYENTRRPYHSPDSSSIDSPRNEKNQIVTEQPSGQGLSGIPGPIGDALDCGCGCRGGKKVACMRSTKDKLISGDLDVNSIYMMFIVVLALIVIANAMNIKHLTKQVKILTKAATRYVPAPGPPEKS